VDVDEAAVLVDEAEQRMRSSRPALALTAASAALELLAGGRVLEDEPSADWAMELSREVERLLRRARGAAWLAHAGVGDHRASLAVAQTAVDADSLDEEAHRAIIMGYHRLGEQGEALRAYERLRMVLVEELGADTGPETESLIGAVLRGEEVVADRHETIAAEEGNADFVGRDGELGALLDRWSKASRGTSTCVLISGESGIGKRDLPQSSRPLFERQGRPCSRPLLRGGTVVVPSTHRRDHPRGRRDRAAGRAPESRGRSRPIARDARSGACVHRGRGRGRRGGR
jgi:hypothetical protein